jgi:hypothetical protein
MNERVLPALVVAAFLLPGAVCRAATAQQRHVAVAIDAKQE